MSSLFILYFHRHESTVWKIWLVQKNQLMNGKRLILYAGTVHMKIVPCKPGCLNYLIHLRPSTFQVSLNVWVMIYNFHSNISTSASDEVIGLKTCWSRLHFLSSAMLKATECAKIMQVQQLQLSGSYGSYFTEDERIELPPFTYQKVSTPMISDIHALQRVVGCLIPILEVIYYSLCRLTYQYGYQKKLKNYFTAYFSTIKNPYIYVKKGGSSWSFIFLCRENKLKLEFPSLNCKISFARLKQKTLLWNSMLHQAYHYFQPICRNCRENI